MSEETTAVEPTEDPTAAQSEPTEPPEAGTGTEPKPAEVDWKAKAREWEKRAKSNAKAAERLAEIEASQQTAEERANEAAKRAEERAKDAVNRVARAELKAALTGVVDSPESVIRRLDVSQFISDDGDVDSDEVNALREEYAAFAPKGPRAPAPNPAQGASGQGQKTVQERIASAEKDGNWKEASRLKAAMLLKNTQ